MLFFHIIPDFLKYHHNAAQCGTMRHNAAQCGTMQLFFVFRGLAFLGKSGNVTSSDIACKSIIFIVDVVQAFLNSFLGLSDLLHRSAQIPIQGSSRKRDYQHPGNAPHRRRCPHNTRHVHREGQYGLKEVGVLISFRIDVYLRTSTSRVRAVIRTGHPTYRPWS